MPKVIVVNIPPMAGGDRC